MGLVNCCSQKEKKTEKYAISEFWKKNKRDENTNPNSLQNCVLIPVLMEV